MPQPKSHLWKYAVIVLIVAVAAAVKIAAALYFEEITQVEVKNPVEAGELSADTVKKHFNADDLGRLGCNVDPALGKITNVENPLIGAVENYSLRSETGCVVTLISNIQASKEYDEGTWAGIRAFLDMLARKKEYELTRYQGNLGEYSELEIFTKDGTRKGFSYSVQSGGFLRQVIIDSENIEPDDNFENILRKKL